MSLLSFVESLSPIIDHYEILSSSDEEIILRLLDNSSIKEEEQVEKDLENRLNPLLSSHFKSDIYYLTVSALLKERILRLSLLKLYDETLEPIGFFTKNKYIEFSNFYPLSLPLMKTKKYQLIKGFSIEWKGKTYPTSEHIYQCEKYDDEEYRELVRNAPTAGLAAKIGKMSLQGINMYKDKEYAINAIRRYKERIKINPNWSTCKYGIMIEIIKAKFDQHEDLRNLLITTYPQRLVEESPYDVYWGEGKNKDGHNHLGRILMAYRDSLLSKNKF